MSVTDYEFSIADFEALEAAMPDAFQVELINGRIYVVPVPDGDHSDIANVVRRQVERGVPELSLFEERGLAVPAYRAGRARPDGAVAPHRYFRGQPPWSDASGVRLVLEITSGDERDADVDRVEKRDAYAQAGIPVYLLIDRHHDEAVVYWEPSGGQYLHEAKAKFGARLTLPAPFGFDLDTAELL